MSVNFLFLVFFLLIDLEKWASAQIMFDFNQDPITDTVKFNQIVDFIIIGAGTG